MRREANWGPAMCKASVLRARPPFLVRQCPPPSHESLSPREDGLPFPGGNSRGNYEIVDIKVLSQELPTTISMIVSYCELQ